jgi:hypothetical protein
MSTISSLTTNTYRILPDRFNKHILLVIDNLKPIEQQPYLHPDMDFFVLHRHSGGLYDHEDTELTDFLNNWGKVNSIDFHHKHFCNVQFGKATLTEYREYFIQLRNLLVQHFGSLKNVADCAFLLPSAASLTNSVDDWTMLKQALLQVDIKLFTFSSDGHYIIPFENISPLNMINSIDEARLTRVRMAQAYANDEERPKKRQRFVNHLEPAELHVIFNPEYTTYKEIFQAQQSIWGRQRFSSYNAMKQFFRKHKDEFTKVNVANNVFVKIDDDFRDL